MECESVPKVVPEVSVVEERLVSAKRRRASSVSSRKRFHVRALSFGESLAAPQQMTPPPTPNASSENLLAALPQEQQPMSFLRAFHPFQTGSSQGTSTVTLQLSTGDVLLVHSIHDNGWADGTKLSTGSRGWLPTNYCEEYDPDQMRTLLKSCLSLFENFRVGGAEIMSDASMVSGIVAGVKCLLEATNCLTRDALIVQSNNKIRRTRKVLLAELSLLVKAAKLVPKHLEQTEATREDDIELENAIDEVILRAFKIVVRSVKFLDMWQDDQTSSALTSYHLVNSPPTPPFDFRNNYYSTSYDSASEVCPSEAGTTYSQTSYSSNGDGRSMISRSRSYSSLNSSFDNNSPISPSANIELTFVIQPGTKATVALTMSYDRLLFLLGSLFERLSKHPQFKSVIQEYANCVISDGLDFVTVVDNIARRDTNNKELVASKDAMFSHISNLANLGTEILSIEQYTVKNTKILNYDETEQLKASATACVRGCCDTYRRAEAALSTIPDFPWDEEPSAAPVEAPAEDKMEVDVPSNDNLLMPPTTEVMAQESLPATPVSMDSPDVTMKDLPPTPESLETKELPALPVEELEADAMQGVVQEEPELTARPTSITPDADFQCIRRVEIVEGPQLAVEELAGRPSVDSQASRTSTVSAETPYQSELIINKDGGIGGGTLPALIERLTLHNAPADALFVHAFYLTFRLFTSPKEFAQTLINRFEAIPVDVDGGQVVRLRVYNAMKQWLESYWRQDTDAEAAEIMRTFSTEKLEGFNTRYAARLRELIDKATVMKHPLVPRLASSVSSLGQAPLEAPLPTPTFARGIRASFIGTPSPRAQTVLDIDPQEMARQLTLKASKMFCAIAPEELVGLEWTKKNTKSYNVRAMSDYATQLAYLVADTILAEDEVKKRATVIKQWVKVADKCLEFDNYDTLMAILCTLNSVAITRLKKTWELLSPKTKQTLEHLRSIVDVSKNNSVLRGRLREAVPPCLPFVGMYLTDLSFIDAGNPCSRPLSAENPKINHVINFDKHLKTAKIVSEFQRFQVPYKFAESEEIQTWLDNELARCVKLNPNDVQKIYKRSCLIEPREPTGQNRPVLAPIETNTSSKGFFNRN